LMKFKTELEDLPFYVIPIRHHFLFNEEEKFNSAVIKFIEETKIVPVSSPGLASAQANH
jgi:tetraacyldisaccharide 4'-kinase